MKPIRLAVSPCPNDTFIFHAWLHGLVAGAPPVEARLLDIDLLNGVALAGEADVIKVSFAAFALLRGDYALLRSGGALGRGVGPLVVARRDSRLRAAPSAVRVAELADGLAVARVAVPGAYTTAALLAGLLAGGLRNAVYMPFDRIMPAVETGEVEAGVVIHEGRFTFGAYGLRRLVDLGEWWEQTTGLPLPLGGIAVSRSLARETQEAVEAAVRGSARYARMHPEASWDFVRENAQEMDAAVCRAHIELYVNDYTLDYGVEGTAAIHQILTSASEEWMLSDDSAGIFWDD